MSFIRLNSLFCFLFLIFFTSSVLADDVYIHHQNYGNTHSKWKNRLEDAGHTVTSSTNSITDFSSYEQYYDLRYSGSSLPTDGLKTILSNGGTVFLNGENTNFQSRNNQIQSFIRDVTSDNSITYSTSLNIDYTGTNEQLSTTTTLSTLPSDWSYLNFAFGGVISNLGTNGKCLAANGQGRCGVALFDGDALDSNYSNGKVIIITDINYASHSQYYTADNKEFLTSLISDVAVSTATTMTVTSVSITSSQSTVKSTATNRTSSENSIRITQSGANLDLDIVQRGDGNFIEGSDFSSVGTLTGDNLNVTLEQGSTSTGASNNNGIGIDVNGDTNTVLIRQGTMGNSDTGGHKAKVNVQGDTNSLTLYQYNDGANTSSHFSHIDITGGQNTVTSYQRNNNSKDLFIDLDGSSNTISTDQKETGNHYLDLDINGNGHTVTATQQGSGDHGARISVTNSGGSSTVTLDQNSSTNQTYTLTQDCTNASGCSTTVTQN